MASIQPADFPRGARIAFQGARGAYSELAIRRCLEGLEFEVLPCFDFAGTFQTVREGRADFAMIPVENALTGSIHDNFDLFFHYPDMEIVAEHRLRIRHNLIGMPDARIEDLREVYSHPQGLLQCSVWLDQYPDLKRTEYFDTAGSVEMVAKSGDRTKAGIASSLAAELYGMKILAPGIETNERNYTRFALLRALHGPQAGLRWPRHDKASLVFGLPDRPGSLLEALSVFARTGCNLKKIESRPIHGRPFEYMFYVDVELPGSTEVMDSALPQLTQVASSVRVLGMYPLSSDP